MADDGKRKGGAMAAVAGETIPAAGVAGYAIIIISHGALAVEMKRALEHLMGPQPLVAALDIPAEETLARTRQRLQEIIEALPQPCRQGRSLIFLSDLFGGTPANLALELLRRRLGAALITGVNLPLLVRLVELRGVQPLAVAVEQAAAVGRRFIRTEHAPEELAADMAGDDTLSSRLSGKAGGA